jgi:hypothetical protein
VLLATIGYPFFEAKWCQVNRSTIELPFLPLAFKGIRIVFISDIHHGPWVTPFYVQQVVDMANQLKPDLICLGGDYVHMSVKYVEPCIAILGELQAPYGVFAVLGNHDHRNGARKTHQALEEAGIRVLTNTGIWLETENERLRLCGVDDLWEGNQNLNSALEDATREDAVLLLSHNPDFAEKFDDDRVGLMLSGHTHGGQVVLPFVGAPFVPSKYKNKYLSGLVQTKSTQVFISKGVGTIAPPIRFCCRPEIDLITLI